MRQGNSKENQSSIETAYRFGEFELHPRERLLKCRGESVPLQPKAFDALQCLVCHAEHLVSKKELTDTLWPSTFVSDANLTNIMVSLRKTVGHETIRTVSKHGYRFMLPVQGQPGITRATSENFTRAKELTMQRSLDSMTRARELYWICLAENPGFASAWAWLGRCCWFLGKFSGRPSADAELANAAFRRAFALDPDLACAHQFYTPVEADSGNARDALVRLLQRTERRPGDPETFTGLVQVLRFCGLIQHSIQAHKRAIDLDHTVWTSVPHTLFLAGEYASTIESYAGHTGYYLDAAAWAALGDKPRAIVLLRDRLAHMALSDLMKGLMASLLAILTDRADEAVRHMEAMKPIREPEVLVYLARHYSHLDLAASSVETLKGAAESGFVCAPDTLQADPWLIAARKHAEFASVLRNAEKLTAQARSILDLYKSAAAELQIA